jgi:CRISPR/Cas system CSM-associated protein Csm4 (group 5 of RAMP superfamily)
MSPETRQKVLDAIAESLPAFFKINEQEVYSPKTIYNMLSQGTGPEIVNIRGQKYLEKDSFLSWLAGTENMKRGRKRLTVCQKAV